MAIQPDPTLVPLDCKLQAAPLRIDYHDIFWALTKSEENEKGPSLV